MKKLICILLGLMLCFPAIAETLTTNGGNVIDFADLPYQDPDAPATVYFTRTSPRRA